MRSVLQHNSLSSPTAKLEGLLWCISTVQYVKRICDFESLPEAEEEGAGLLAHLVVWDDVSKCVADVPEVLQHRVALLPLAHQDGIGIHLHS